MFDGNITDVALNSYQIGLLVDVAVRVRGGKTDGRNVKQKTQLGALKNFDGQGGAWSAGSDGSGSSQATKVCCVRRTCAAARLFSRSRPGVGREMSCRW